MLLLLLHVHTVLLLLLLTRTSRMSIVVMICRAFRWGRPEQFRSTFKN